MISYLKPYTPTQKHLAATMRRLVRDLAAAMRVSSRLVQHPPESGVEEYQLPWLTVQFVSAPETEERLDNKADYSYGNLDHLLHTVYGNYYVNCVENIEPPKKPVLIFELGFFEQLQEVLLQTQVTLKSIEDEVSLRMVHSSQSKTLTISIKPVGEEKEDWRIVIEIAPSDF
jgi:hypothetical protein